MPTHATSRRRAAALPPEQRRERLVRAAMPLLLEHGPAVTTRQLAEAAGIAEGTIFRVFPDKESLIEAVVEAAFDPVPFERELSDLPEGLDLTGRLTAAVALLQRRVGSLARLMAAVGLTRPPGTSAEAGRRPPTSVEAIAQLFDADAARMTRTPMEAATVLRAMTIAGTHPMMVDEPTPPAEIVDLLLHGLLARPPDASVTADDADTEGDDDPC